MIRRWVANMDVSTTPSEFFHLHYAIDEFNEHFPKNATRIEMSRGRLDIVQMTSAVPAYDLKDAENRLGVELVLDEEMSDDLIRIVSEWKEF
jgi:hypothetical protein